jgi:catechol 2,3-dioxygenase-like lactoylglutathione lyase family enzyme
VEITSARLCAPAELLAELDEFYAAFGRTGLEFVAGEGEPFYHFAFLVPGDRFDAAFDWARERYELLPRQNGELVFDFSFWSALACYFEDPAGNIVELIAHRGLEESGSAGPFSGEELLGLSEVGLVGDIPAMARDLEELDLHVWSGSADDPDGLAFVGEKARTLILCPVGRGWLPIDRRAEPHPVDVTLSGTPEGTVGVNGHHVTRR